VVRAVVCAAPCGQHSWTVLGQGAEAAQGGHAGRGEGAKLGWERIGMRVGVDVAQDGTGPRTVDSAVDESRHGSPSRRRS